MTPAMGRLVGLDALRGLAALCVVLYHIALRYPAFMQGRPTPGTPLFPGFAQVEAGIVPVLWFFLLSGFVITLTIDRSRTPMDFVVNRLSRIYPAYWASLLLAVAIAAWSPLPGISPTLPVILVNASMLQAWVGVPDVAGVYWSLAVELMFYAFALALFGAGQWRRMPLAALVWAALAFGNALLARQGIETSWRLGRLLLIPYAPFLAAGMALHQLWRAPARSNSAWAAVTLGLCCSTILLTYTLVAAASCLAMMGLIGGAAMAEARGGLRWLALPPLVWLGSISYPLYLVHEYPSYVVMRALDPLVPHVVAMAVALALSLGLAVAVNQAVERPAMRAIRRAWTRRGRAALSGAPKSETV